MKTIRNLYLLFSLCSFISLNAQEYEILFTKQIYGSDHIFSINTAGVVKQITNHPRKDSSPVISPDGNDIIFTSERVGWWKIWSMNLKKNSFTQLTNVSSAEYNPSWSPDGKKILFVSARSGNSDIYIMDKNGKNLKQLTQNKTNDTMPMWGKDGFIYYSSKVKGVYQIVKIKPDGTNQQIITKGKGNKYGPQLSNDQKRILYYGGRDKNPEIYVLMLDDHSIKRITNHSLMDIRPKWSSDDKKIVFERGNKKNNQHIYIMDADGSHVKKLTRRNYNYAPSFVPNGIKMNTDK